MLHTLKDRTAHLRFIEELDRYTDSTCHVATEVNGEPWDFEILHSANEGRIIWSIQIASA